MEESKTKPCQNCKSEFTIEPEDFEFYEKIDVPEPTFCSQCRAQRRLSFKNLTKLYKRKDDMTGELVFSMINSASPMKVYESDNWNSDKWDPMDYGRDYDFSKPFFEQIKELRADVPIVNRAYQDLVNSDYCMNVQEMKNCYLVFGSALDENCAYGVRLVMCNDSYDGFGLLKCDLCYEGFKLTSCYKTFFSAHCSECQEVFFCNGCIGCQNCFGCVNLRHKKYHIFNQEYSKDEYFKKLKEFNIGSFENKEEVLRAAREFRLKFPVRSMRGRKNDNVSGDEINNCRNVHESFLVDEGESLKYCQMIGVGCKDCYDYSDWGNKADLIYESMMSGNGINKLKFCQFCINENHDMEYCMECFNSHDLFACVGLRHKSYCIFNRQYTKEEYEQLVPKIKAHMDEMPYTSKAGSVYKYGEFFPPEISPFAYNETMAQEFFPLTKEEALKKGYGWYDKPKSEYEPTIKTQDLPDHFKDADNSILKEIIECKNKDSCQGSGVFQIISSELKFLKEQELPLPRLCPECRYIERIKQRNPMKLHKKQCMCSGKKDETGVYDNQENHKHGDEKCPNTFETTYAPDRKEIVYCKECYQKEVE